jgi:shikimate dehydrogenase
MSALVLGAGGSARAVVWALREAGAGEVSIWNRTPERAVALARDLDARAVTAPETADLLVNCTSVGLESEDGSLKQSATETQGLNLPAVTFDQVGNYSYVVDLVYSSSPTPLLVAARSRGVRAVGGLEILLAQGALSFELWTGVQPPLDVMRRALD